MLTDDKIKELLNHAAFSSASIPLDPRDIAELCTRLISAEAKVKVLEDAGTAILDFYNGPLEAKRPDVFQQLMVRLAAALQEQSK
jgi:hypothetical protein